MVTRSTINYEQHKTDVFNIFAEKYGVEKAKVFIDFYASRYDAFKRSFIDYKLAWVLFDDYMEVQKNVGMRWYACVGSGGTGKTTLAKNVGYFFDNTFNAKRVKFDVDGIITQLKEFEAVGSFKACVLDEPDQDIHPNSTKGKRLRSILGKGRQQQAFMVYCATDMRDIPSYIYKKLSAVFFTPYVGKAMFFKDRPKKFIYVINKIKDEYDKMGYGVFFKYKKGLGCLQVDTTKYLPLSVEEEKKYIEEKKTDYQQELEDFPIGNEIPERQTHSEREMIIRMMKKKGMSNREIGELIGISKQRVGQILSKFDHGKGKGII